MQFFFDIKKMESKKFDIKDTEGWTNNKMFHLSQGCNSGC